MVRAVQPASKWKLLVVDGNSAKLLNAICKSHEILEENVTLIEELYHKRQSFPNYEAIYFMTPSERSIDRFIVDFNQDKPLYLAAHIFFISFLEDALFDKLKKSGMTKHIKTLKEMNIDFIGLEPQIFSVDIPLSPFSLYNPMNPTVQSTDLQRASKRILSMLITLGENPFIRYYDPTGTGSNPSSKLAGLVQNELDALCKADPEYPPPTEFRRAILIIVDRTIDMMTPFLHEFTYQSMMSDLLIGDGKDANSPSYANLDENDPIWTLIRHWHFAEAVEYIRESFSSFLSDNKAAAAALGQNSGPQGIDSLKQMKDTLSSLPQFQEMKAKFSVHINICQECKSIFEKRRLDLVAAVEQDLATGETSDGRAPKNVILDLIPALDNKNATQYDKLRALVIYIIAMDGIQEVERRRLLETAKVSTEDAQAITNLSYFDIKLAPGQMQANPRSKTKDWDRYTYWGSHKLDRKRKKNKADDDLPYDLSRYVPLMKRVVDDQVTNSLSKEIFPWVNEPTPDQLGIVTAAPKMFRFTSNGLVPPDPNFPNSLRTTRASWTNRKTANKGAGKSGAGGASGGGNNSNHLNSPGSGGDNGQENIDLRRNGSRIILFSLGGLTHSEIRCAYEATREHQREVYLGSTYVYNPSQFIDIVKNLHKADPSQTPIGAQYGAKAAVVEDSSAKVDIPKEKKGIFSAKKK